MSGLKYTLAPKLGPNPSHVVLPLEKVVTSKRFLELTEKEV